MKSYLFSKKSHFSIRKLSVGVCSVIIGTTLLGQTTTVHANEGTAPQNEPLRSGINTSTEQEQSSRTEDASEPVSEPAPAGGEVANEQTAPQPARPEVVDNNDYTLHYETPAAKTYKGWESEALPIGNGEMGAKIFGLVGEEKIQFNEKTLWSGGPTPESTTYNGGNLANKHEYLPQIREALERGDLATAKRLAETHLKGPHDEQYGRYLAFGDVLINFTNQEKELSSVTNYRRELDIKTAVSTTRYTQDGTTFEREHFASFPDDVTVTRLMKTGEKLLDFDVSMRLTTDLQKNHNAYDDARQSNYKTGTVTYSDEGILLSGEVTNNKLKFASYLGIDTDGQLSRHEDKLSVRGATYATLLMNAKTDFAQNPKTNYRRTGANVVEEVKATVNRAKEKSYEQIKSDHITDYKSLFDRVKLNLTDAETNRPTNTLLSGYNQDNGQQLEELFFQYGRYLMITSSRDKLNALPANLQGVWNAVDNPPWNSDYHLNVNLQMNYWPVYSTNIAETALPLINYIDDMRYYGRIAAKEYGGITSAEGEENGWLAHTQATPFGWTTPGWDYYWGWSPASNAWIMQNVYDYYKFTQDRTYLETKIYPMLKETAKFWNSFLHYDRASDRYVSSPSYSPEHGTISIGNTFDQSLVWQLFHDYMEAAQTLNKDADFVAEIKTKFDKLKPLHINQAGRIKEWYEEDTPAFTGEGVQAHHRHVSELVGLFPGTLFSKDNPEYLEAAKATLNARGDGGTGWSKANKINLWARLLDGNRAHRLLAEQLRGSTLTNLWDTHTPFQIDGNFGATSGMTEMLLQSHTGYIAPLPALPDAWKTGQVSGLMARGNVEVDMAWQEKNLTSMTVQAKSGGTIQIDYPRIETATITINGQPAAFRRVQDDRIEITTQAGDVVLLSDILGRVTDLRVERTGDTSANLTFSPIEQAAYYRIERVTRDAAGQVTETRTFTTTAPTYRDTTILPSHQYTYQVQAVLLNQISTAPSNSSSISDVKVILDDRDSSIRYGSVFGNWPDSSLYGGTEKYGDLTGRTVSEADRTLVVPFVGTGIQVYGLKHSGLGKALVYVDGQAHGEMDFYGSSGVQKGVLIGQVDGLPEGAHELKLVINPAPVTRTNEKNKISLDYFRVLTTSPNANEVLDDRDQRVRYGAAFDDWSDTALHAGTEKYADITGTQRIEAERTATLTFTGTGIQIFGLKSTSLGKATVTIDGEAVDPLIFNKATGGTEKGVLIGEYRNLTDGEHTIAITVAPETLGSGRHKISLDKFVILKAPIRTSYPAAVADARVGADYLQVTLPTGDWTKVEVFLPEQTNPIVLRQSEDGVSVDGSDQLTIPNSGQIRLTLPEHTVTGLIRAVTYQGDTVSGTAFALLSTPTVEEGDGETSNQPDETDEPVTPTLADAIIKELDNQRTAADTGNKIVLGDDVKNYLKTSDKGTIYVEYRVPENAGAFYSIFNATSSSDRNSYTSLYSNNGQVGLEVRTTAQTLITGTERVKNGEWHAVAFTYEKSPETNQTTVTIYVNGVLSKTQTVSQELFSSIVNFNHAQLGAAQRAASTAWGVSGVDIRNFTLYNKALTAEELINRSQAFIRTPYELPTNPGEVVTEKIAVFSAGNNGGKNAEGVGHYRIPAMLVTDKGTVLAVGDQRRHHSADWGDIAIVAKRSSDQGRTWGSTIKIIDLKQNPNAQDKSKDNVLAIDAALVQDPVSKRIFAFYDMYPEGQALFGMPSSREGHVEYTTINGKAYLNLYKDGETTPYTVRENGVVYTPGGVATNYRVDQEGGGFANAYTDLGDLYEGDRRIGNIFFQTAKTSPFRTALNSFMWMSYSDDDGVTWSRPKDLTSSLKQDYMKFLGTGPGTGIALHTGPHKGRLIIPAYATNWTANLNSQSSLVFYSDDQGETWHAGKSVNDDRRLANGTVLHLRNMNNGGEIKTESTVLQLNNGDLKLFMRGQKGKVTMATSRDGGATWENEIEQFNDVNDVYVQLSAIRIEREGKEYVILANAEGPGRTNGHVRLAEVDPDGNLNWINHRLIQDGNFAYNSIQHLGGDDFALLYEHNAGTENTYSLYYKTFNWTFLTSPEPKLPDNHVASVSFEEDDTLALLTFEHSVLPTNNPALLLSNGRQATYVGQRDGKTLSFRIQPTDKGNSVLEVASGDISNVNGLKVNVATKLGDLAQGNISKVDNSALRLIAGNPDAWQPGNTPDKLLDGSKTSIAELKWDMESNRVDGVYPAAWQLPQTVTVSTKDGQPIDLSAMLISKRINANGTLTKFKVEAFRGEEKIHDSGEVTVAYNLAEVGHEFGQAGIQADRVVLTLLEAKRDAAGQATPTMLTLRELALFGPRTSTREREVSEAVDFARTTRYDDTKDPDYREVISGVKGEQVKLIRETLVNGKVTTTTLVNANVRRTEPTDEVTIIGAKRTETRLRRVPVEIDFTIERTEDPNLDKGKEEVDQEGVKGRRVDIYEDIYVNDVLETEGTTPVRSEEEESARPKKVRVGTKEVTPPPVDGDNPDVIDTPTQPEQPDTPKPTVPETPPTTDTPEQPETLKPSEVVHQPTGVKVKVTSSQNADIAAKIAGASVAHKETGDVETPEVLKGKDFDIFDIELVDKDGQPLDWTGEAKVTLPIDAGKEVAEVFYLPENGQPEQLDFETKEVTDASGKTSKDVTFTAKHFSQYGIVYKSATVPTPSTPITPPTVIIDNSGVVDKGDQGTGTTDKTNTTTPVVTPAAAAPTSTIASSKPSLPATGDADSAIAVLGTVALISALGLAGVRRKGD